MGEGIRRERQRKEGRKKKQYLGIPTYICCPASFYLILLPNAGGGRGGGVMGHELTFAFHSWALECLQSVAGQEASFASAVVTC